MIHSLKYFLTIIVSCLISVNSFSQSDTTKSKVFDSENSVTKSSGQLKSNTANSKVTPNNPNLNFNNELNVDAVNKNLKNYTSTNNPNFLMENLPEDNDIIGKKYWKGEDITHKRLGSTYSLGTSNSATKTVRVVCRDYSYVDGDIIKIYINEQALKNNVVLKGGNYMVYLELNEGYNRIDFQALNQGLSGPNTAELRLYDANDNLISSNEWNLLTGQIATLGVIYK